MLCSSRGYIIIIKQELYNLGLILSSRNFQLWNQVQTQKVKWNQIPQLRGGQSVLPYLPATQKWQARAIAHGLPKVCSHHCLDELWSPEQEWWNTLPYFFPSCHCPSLCCDGTNPRHPEMGATSCGCSIQGHEEWIGYLESVCQMRGKKNVSAHLWASKWFWLYPITTHTWC